MCLPQNPLIDFCVKVSLIKYYGRENTAVDLARYLATESIGCVGALNAKALK
jgi:hypothetical protein